MYFPEYNYKICFRLARDLHEKLLVTRRKVVEHGITERHRQMQEISQAAAAARSTLHKKLRQYRATLSQSPRISNTDINQKTSSSSNGQGVKAEIGTSITTNAVSYDNSKEAPSGITVIMLVASLYFPTFMVCWLEKNQQGK